MKTVSKNLLGLFFLTIWACHTSLSHKSGASNDQLALLRIHTNISKSKIKEKEELIHELEKSKLIEKKTVADIPKFIKSYIDSVTTDFSLANPGEKWQNGCFSGLEIVSSSKVKKIDPKTGDTTISTIYTVKPIPTRQLININIGKKIVLMTYYSGGFGVSKKMLIFRIKRNKVIEMWCGYINVEPNNKAQLLKYMEDYKENFFRLHTDEFYF